MEELRLKCSQMSLSDLKVLKKVINHNYDFEIGSAASEEDAAGLKTEKDRFNRTVTELLLTKATQIVYS